MHILLCKIVYISLNQVLSLYLCFHIKPRFEIDFFLKYSTSSSDLKGFIILKCVKKNHRRIKLLYTNKPIFKIKVVYCYFVL